jgi:8-oxo-dGTP pyrophosphatase MutT (NUDIX family)
MPMSGPKRRGVVAVIVREGRFLVIRRSALVRAPGMLCFPGGAIEEGESEPAALCRELQEELSLTVRPKRRLWRSVTPWQVELAWWLAEVDDPQPPRPNPQEVAEVFWLTAAEILQAQDVLPSNVQFLAAWQAGQIELECV